MIIKKRYGLGKYYSIDIYYKYLNTEDCFSNEYKCFTNRKVKIPENANIKKLLREIKLKKLL